MRVESVTVFRFFFSFEGNELAIPMAASNIEEAKVKLSRLLLHWSAEIANSNAPTISPIQRVTDVGRPAPTTEILELRIEELMKDIAGAKLRETKRTVAQTIKEWTGFPMDPSNFAAIVDELEKIKKG